MAKLQEITATFLQERFRFTNADGDVIVGSAFQNGEVQKEISIKGQADIDELLEDQTYRFFGSWTEYKNKRTGITEDQFVFQSFILQQPHSRSGIITYLKRAGEGFGFGVARATRLWELYGTEAVRTLRESPDDVAAALADTSLRIPAVKLVQVAGVLARESATEGCTLDLMDVLTGRGFPKSTARLVIRDRGVHAARDVRRNPYLLMKYHGVGFKKTDALYLDLKLPTGRLKRQALCAWYKLASNTEGHTWYPLAFAAEGIRENIGAAELRIEDAITLANRAKATAELRTIGARGELSASGDCRWLAEGRKAANEGQLAAMVADAILEPHNWPDVADLRSVAPQISDHQIAELAKSLQGVIAILGGSPGTGKTFAAAALIKLLVGLLGWNQIAICAPTGKAAVRITEVMASYGIQLRARTWHSLLIQLETSGQEYFPYKVLVGDEESMVDTDLMARIFRHRSFGTHVLLVGDVNQLPPVGHGAPLRDLIAAGLPYGELREIKRNSGGIVEACAAIRDAKPWQAGDNLILADCSSPEQQIATMLLAIKKAAANGRDPIWDVQVVVPVNKKSPLARTALNKILQAELNPNPGIAGSPFRIGDKAVNTKNGYVPSVEFDPDDPETRTNDRGEVYVANGELGEVVAVEEKLTIIRLNNPSRVVKIPRGKAKSDDSDGDPIGDDGEAGSDSANDKTTTGCNWDLGFALSVHKAQGSEWPVVIGMIDEYAGAKLVCSREWLYTCISRAKEKCLLIGKKSVADAMCRRPALDKRKTFLKERILVERATLALAEL